MPLIKAGWFPGSGIVTSVASIKYGSNNNLTWLIGRVYQVASAEQDAWQMLVNVQVTQLQALLNKNSS